LTPSRKRIKPLHEENPEMITETDTTEDLVELVEFTTSVLLKWFA
jgi:hypothetical protein